MGDGWEVGLLGRLGKTEKRVKPGREAGQSEGEGLWKAARQPEG